MTPFKIGQEVIAIENIGSLIKGKTYIVRGCAENFIYVGRSIYAYHIDWFSRKKTTIRYREII